MPGVEMLTVALTADVAAELRSAVSAGDYFSVSEAVGDALREWQRRRRVEAPGTEALRRLVQAGMESGPGLDADAVFGGLRARLGLSAGG